MDLTIILTVYNKEQYLHKAFDALLNQDNTAKDEYEILVVNDGSTDGSKAIITDYCQRDSRIRVLEQDNQGLSMARNNGTDAAKGEYVWYVDADDFISPKSVRLICDAIKSQPDVIAIYAKEDEKDAIRNQVPLSVKTGCDVLLSRKWEQCGVFWILRKDFLNSNDLHFLPGIYHEDAEFTPRMLYYASSVIVIPEVLYNIIHEPNSITRIPRSKRAFDCLTVAENLRTFIIENKINKSVIGKVINDVASVMINIGLFIIVVNPQEEQKRFNDSFRSKPQLTTTLLSSSHINYNMEGLLYKVTPMSIIKVYKMLKSFK